MHGGPGHQRRKAAQGVKNGTPTLDLVELKDMSIQKLNQVAKDMGIAGAAERIHVAALVLAVLVLPEAAALELAREAHEQQHVAIRADAPDILIDLAQREKSHFIAGFKNADITGVPGVAGAIDDVAVADHDVVGAGARWRSRCGSCSRATSPMDSTATARPSTYCRTARTC